MAGKGVLRWITRPKWSVEIAAVFLFVQNRDAQRVGSDIDQHRPHIDAADQPALDGGTHGNTKIGIDFGVQLPAQPVLQQAMHQRRAAGPAYHDHLVDLPGS